MAKTAIGVGSSANDGTGDPLRTAMQSTNSNFDELYTLLGNGSALSISGDVTMASSGAVTIAGSPAAGELCYFDVYRDVSDGNDDMTEDAKLIGIKLFYTIDDVHEA